MERIATLRQHLTSAKTKAKAPRQPLQDVVVLDLSQMVSGPMATQILADQGADVIKVEPLQGEAGRVFSLGSGIPAISNTINRNKRSLAIDLQSDAGREALRRLVVRADVFVHNFRPGVVERMKVSEQDLRKMNPNLIYCAISGFGQTGPMAKKRVYDPIIQAVSGMASAQGVSGGRPRMIRLLIPDQITAMVASQAITAAIVHKLRTGEGQTVDLNMLDTAVWYMWPEAMVSHTLLGPEGDMMRAMDLSARDMVFETKDGKFITASAVSDAEWEGLCRSIGREEWIDDDRFCNAVMRRVNANERLNLVENVVRTLSSEEVLARMDALDVPSALVSHPREELIHNEQVKHNEILFETEHPHPGVGPVRLCKPPAKFSKSPFELRHHCPVAGEDCEDILVNLAGFSPQQVDKMAAEGAIKIRTIHD